MATKPTCTQLVCIYHMPDTQGMTTNKADGTSGRGEVIARHIGNVFREVELAREGFVQILHRTPDGGGPRRSTTWTSS